MHRIFLKVGIGFPMYSGIQRLQAHIEHLPNLFLERHVFQLCLNLIVGDDRTVFVRT